MRRRIISLLLAAVMVLGMGQGAFAAEAKPVTEDDLAEVQSEALADEYAHEEPEPETAGDMELMATGDWVTVDGIVGGQIQFDSSTGTITDCETTVTAANIPETISGVKVTSIGSYAFYNCKSLTSVDIGDSVISIGDRAFYNCTSLTGVYITDIAAWCKIDFDVSTSNPLYYAYNLYVNKTLVTELIIPNSVTSIGNYAFCNCRSLTSVNIPNSVTSIGGSAFENCTSLTSVSIGNSVTSIGSYAFENCSSLASVNIPNSVTSIKDFAFCGCTSLTSVCIGNGVTRIGEDAFSGCTSLSKISVDAGNQYYSSDESGVLFNKSKTALIQYPTGHTGSTYSIPNSVTTVGEGAFSSCTSLTSVSIGNSVTSIGGNAFYGCTSLTSVSIGNSVTSIGYTAFSHCTSLTSVNIPNSVTSIGIGAFECCINLTSVDIPNSVTSIGGDAFYGCTSLTSVSIGNSVTSIGYAAFSNCTSLTSVDIPNSVTSIRSYAFSSCTSLTSVNIPNSVTSIEFHTFYGCTSLTSVSIGNSVTSIGSDAFYGCTSLTSVEIPNSVTSIGNNAFSSCTSLTDVYYTGSAEQWSQISISWFYNECLTNATIHYNWSGSAEDFKVNGVPKGKYVIHVVDTKGASISGASVSYSSQSGTTGADGDVIFNKYTVGNPLITVTKNEYKDYSNKNTNYTKSSTSYETITLRREDEPDYSLTTALYSNLADMSLSTDLLTQTKAVNLQISTGWNLIGDFDFGNFYLKCKAADSSGVTRYELYQGTSKIAESTDGYFALKNTQFSSGGNCFVNVVAADGSKQSTRINLTFAKNQKNSAAKIDLSRGKASISVPDSVPFFGGSDVEVSLPELPVDFYVSTEAIHIGFNIKAYSTEKPKDTESFSKWWDNQKNTMRRVKNLYSTVTASTLKNIVKNDKSFALPGGEFKVSVCGYAEASWASSTAKGEIYFMLDYTTPTFGFNTVVVCVPVTVQINGTAKLQIGGTISYDWENATLLYSGKLDFTVGLEAFGGVGAGEVVGVGAYGKASVLTELLGFGTTSKIKLNKIDLTGELGLKAYLACFTYSKPFAYNTWHLYTANNVTMSALEEDESSPYDAAEYEIEDLSYLKAESEWFGNSSGEDLSLMEAEATTNLQPLLEGTYNNCQPTMISDGNGHLYAAFLRGNSETGSIYLAVTSYDGTAWKTPVAVSAGAICDSSPILCVDAAGTVWLAYAKTNQELTTDSLLTFAQSQSIVVGTIDPETLAFTSKKEYSGTGYLNLPSMELVGSTLTLSWLCSTVTDDNSVLSPASSDIYIATLSGGSWTEAARVTTVNSPITQLCLGEAAGSALIGYITDTDKDRTTTDDLTLYTVSPAGETVKLSEGVTGKLCFAALPRTSEKTFLWNGDDVLRSVSASVAVPGITKEYAVVGSRIYFSGATDGCSNLMVVQYAADGTSSEVICLTDTERYLENLNVAVLNGQDYVLGMTTAASIKTDAVDLTKNLVWSKVQPVYDLELAGLSYCDAKAAAGDSIDVTLTVVNAGDHSITGFDVLVDGANVKETATELAPGASCEVTITLEYPNSLRKYTISVTQSDGDDYTPDNNQTEVSMGYADLSVSLECEQINTCRTIIATVTNVGACNTSGTLTLTDAEGKTLGEAALNDLASGDSYVVRCELDADFELNGDEITAYVSCEDEELYSSDNTAYVVVPDLLEQLTIQSVDAADNSITIEAVNAGSTNQVICAFYNADGRFLGADVKALAAGNSECTFVAGKQGTAYAKVFFLNQAFAPIQPEQIVALAA